MGQLGPFLRKWVGSGDGRVGVTYWCNGCAGAHGVTIEGPGAWYFDGNYDSPTFAPSQLTMGVRYKRNPDGSRNGAEVERGFDGEPLKEICHTFIRGGMVEFLSDCTHELAGKTLPLPMLPDWLRDEEEAAQ